MSRVDAMMMPLLAKRIANAPLVKILRKPFPIPWIYLSALKWSTFVKSNMKYAGMKVLSCVNIHYIQGHQGWGWGWSGVGWVCVVGGGGGGGGGGSWWCPKVVIFILIVMTKLLVKWDNLGQICMKITNIKPQKILRNVNCVHNS